MEEEHSFEIIQEKISELTHKIYAEMPKLLEFKGDDR